MLSASILSALITLSVCFAVLSCEASSPTRSPLLTGYEPCALALPTDSSHCQRPTDKFVEGSGYSCVPYTLIFNCLLTASVAPAGPTLSLRIPCPAHCPITWRTTLSDSHLPLHQLSCLSAQPFARYSPSLPACLLSISAAPPTALRRCKAPCGPLLPQLCTPLEDVSVHTLPKLRPICSSRC